MTITLKSCKITLIRVQTVYNIISNLRKRLIYKFLYSAIEPILKKAGLFDAEWYKINYSDTQKDRSGALEHYITHGISEGRAPTRDAHTLGKFVRVLFDREWYARKNPDVVSEEMDLLGHYVEYGHSEGRHPSFAAAENAVFAELGRASFNPTLYMSLNPDILQSGVDPLRHYVEYGHAEGRLTQLDVDDRDPSLDARQASLRWYYIDDTIEWLNRNSHLTGVGRVTSEILLAGLFETDQAFIPCVRDPSGRGLVRLTDWEPIYRIARAIGYEIPHLSINCSIIDHFRPDILQPSRGDHVVFTGVIWNTTVALLFTWLKDRGITISVLINDIIPITQPELVSVAHARSFAHWLSVTAQTADIIFVTNTSVAKDVSKWLLDSHLLPKVSIRQLPLGARRLAVDEAAIEVLAKSVDERFVLSVGTIDRRKNQRALCEVWIDLYDGTYGADLPQLVLAGRDDEGLSSEIKFARLMEQRKIVFLDHLSDVEVGRLYQTCLFTVFPSTSEGYGLPVSESLRYGKLCLSSDLPVIRSHAGDLPWYFDPNSRQSLVAQIDKALSSPTERMSAEARIRSEFRPTPWIATVQAIMEASDVLMSRPEDLPLIGSGCSACHHQVSAPQVSFLIVNRDSAPEVVRLVRWITTNIPDISYEIIIADNGSDRADLSALSFLSPLTKVVDLGCDRFGGEAYNIAAEIAVGHHICIISDLSWVLPEYISAALDITQSKDLAKAVVLFSAPLPDRSQPVVGEGAYTYPACALDHSKLLEISSGAQPIGGKFFAMMLLDREAFVRARGFDLAFEPGPYEDIDLIMRMISAGYPVSEIRYVDKTGALLTHGSATTDEESYVVNLHRQKFVDRWSSYPKSRSRDLEVHFDSLPSPNLDREFGQDKLTAVLHTPFPLTPGGGERYLLSIAALLSANYRVILALPHLYSRMRLENLAEELSLNLDLVEIMLLSDVLQAPAPDLFINLDNFIIPRQSAIGQKNFYICQFPFPMHTPIDAEKRARFAGYQKILAYSRYTRRHIEARLDSIQAPDVPVCLVPPPVTQIRASIKRANTIMTVGRFFVGGHAKRHDLLIEAFTSLMKRFDQAVEFHVVGSTIPEKRHMDYVERLLNMAANLPIHFHFNARPELLNELYASTEIYWHGAGLDADLTNEPEAAEHFGISVVEAMSAGAIPFALASGGPREIIEHGVNGFLYDSIEMLVDGTKTLLSCSATERQRISQAAAQRSRDYSPNIFAHNIRKLISD